MFCPLIAIRMLIQQTKFVKPKLKGFFEILTPKRAQSMSLHNTPYLVGATNWNYQLLTTCSLLGPASQHWKDRSMSAHTQVALPYGLVCNDDTLPIVKRRIGDYIMDPIIYDSWNYKIIVDYSQKNIYRFTTHLFCKKIETEKTPWVGLYCMVL